jgi:hypothetical protein
VDFFLIFWVTYFWQIRTEEMNLIAERGIAAHYSGRVFVTGLVGHAMPNGRSSRGKPVCLNNANIALRVMYQFPVKAVMISNPS